MMDDILNKHKYATGYLRMELEQTLDKLLNEVIHGCDVIVEIIEEEYLCSLYDSEDSVIAEKVSVYNLCKIIESKVINKEDN